MRSGMIIILVVVVLGIVLLGVLSLDNINKTYLGNKDGNVDGDNGVGGSDDLVSDPIEKEEDSDGGTGGGGGGTGTGDEDGAQGSGVCEEVILPYLSFNLNHQEVCIEESPPGVCIYREITCNVDINNLDENAGGIFRVEFIFFVVAGPSASQWIDNELERITEENNIGAREIVTFTTVYDIQSIGEGGVANQNISCLYDIVTIPTKEVCY